MWTTLEPLAPELFWILCVGFVIAFLLAFSVGANDVSNSFGTSVGSGVLTVTQACILATFFEVAGATLLGYAVCDTFRRNVYDVSQYDGFQKELMLGALACLIGSASWNLLATYLKMPISGTHSIMGATIGFSIVLRGWGSIKWTMILRIVASWFASPLISGFISSLIYLFISKTIIRKKDALKNGLKVLPLFYGVTIFINVASVVINGPNVFGLNELSWYTGLFISLVFTAIAICSVALVIVPRLRESILSETGQPAEPHLPPAPLKSALKAPKVTLALEKTPSSPLTGISNEAFAADNATGDQKPELTLNPAQLAGKEQAPDDGAEKPALAPKPAHLLKRQEAQDSSQPAAPNTLEEIELNDVASPQVVVIKPKRSSSLSAEPPKGDKSNSMINGERLVVFRLFSSLQIMTACFASFAHGTNDVSNAVAPLIPIWNIYSTGHEDVSQQTQVWILAFGGIGICTGLWAWGRAVMSTVGDGLTQLTPSKGFAIELGAAISVLFATKFGLPISTTHCKVGSVVIVGLVSSRLCAHDNAASDADRKSEERAGGVDWKLFGHIATTWLVTVPLAALASALVMLLLKWLVLEQ